jgi:hypothetical protein
MLVDKVVCDWWLVFRDLELGVRDWVGEILNRKNANKKTLPSSF